MKNIFLFSALFSFLCFCSCSDEDLQNGEVITEIDEEEIENIDDIVDVPQSVEDSSEEVEKEITFPKEETEE